MATKKSNVQKLQDAGVLDTSEMTDEHHRALNEELSDDEVKALIKAKGLLRSKHPIKPSSDGGFF